MDIEQAMERSLDMWKLMFAHEKLIESLPPQRQKAAYAKARHLFRRVVSHALDLLQPHDIRVVVFEGKPYEPNYPVEAVNAEDFHQGSELVVATTLEPALVQRGRVLRFAKVVLTERSHPNESNEKGEQHVHRN